MRPEAFPYGENTHYYMDRGGRIMAFPGPAANISDAYSRYSGQGVEMEDEVRENLQRMGNPENARQYARISTDAQEALQSVSERQGAQGAQQGQAATTEAPAQGETVSQGVAPFDPYFQAPAYRTPIRQGGRAGYSFPGFGRDPEARVRDPDQGTQPTEPDADPEPSPSRPSPTPEPEPEPDPTPELPRAAERGISQIRADERQPEQQGISYEEMTASDPRNLSDWRIDLNARNFIQDNVPWWAGLTGAAIRGIEQITRPDFERAGQRMFGEDGEAFMEAMGPVDRDGGITGGTSRAAFADMNRIIGPQQADNQEEMEPVSNLAASARAAGLGTGSMGAEEEIPRLRGGYVPTDTMSAAGMMGTPSGRGDFSLRSRPDAAQMRGSDVREAPFTVTPPQRPARPIPDLRPTQPEISRPEMTLPPAATTSPSPQTRPDVVLEAPPPPPPPVRPDPPPQTGGGGAPDTAPFAQPDFTPPTRPQPPQQPSGGGDGGDSWGTGTLTGGQTNPMTGGTTVVTPGQRPTPPSRPDQSPTVDTSFADQFTNGGGGGGDSGGFGSGGGGGWTNPDVGRPTRPGEVTTGPGQSSQSGGGGGGSGGGGKIVCTAMNERYGFGSFRNAFWLKYAADNLTPHHEVGYHAIFRPLVRFAYESERFGSKTMRSALEHIARHRSADIRAEMRGAKRDRIGQAERAILEPSCYLVGKIIHFLKGGS